MTNSKFISLEPDLTYDDVLINPTISTITSRFGQDLNPFYVDGKLPIVSSPMDSIFSKSFATASKDKLYAVFSHRFQTHEKQIKNLIDGANGAVIGLQTTTTEIMEMIKYGAKHILLDVANGGNIAVIEKLNAIQWVRDNAFLWAGNVANKETYFHLRELCDYVRVGIGGGCFVPETKVKTVNGVFNIADIRTGDFVYTHTGEVKEVISTLTYISSEQLILINDKLKSTKSHEYYVVHKEHYDIVNDENIHKYAKWVPADKLSDEYFLIELGDE
jgi:hypothetical protein